MVFIGGSKKRSRNTETILKSHTNALGAITVPEIQLSIGPLSALRWVYNSWWGQYMPYVTNTGVYNHDDELVMIVKVYMPDGEGLPSGTKLHCYEWSQVGDECRISAEGFYEVDFGYELSDYQAVWWIECGGWEEGPSHPIITGGISASKYCFGDREWKIHNKEMWNGTNSKYPVIFTVNPPPDVTPPAIPTGLTLEIGDEQISLDWDDNSELDLDYYKVYRDDVHVASPTTSKHVDTGLTNLTKYCYKISAVDDSDNESDLTVELCGTPVPAPLPILSGHPKNRLLWTQLCLRTHRRMER